MRSFSCEISQHLTDVTHQVEILKFLKVVREQPNPILLKLIKTKANNRLKSNFCVLKKTITRIYSGWYKFSFDYLSLTLSTICLHNPLTLFTQMTFETK